MNRAMLATESWRIAAMGGCVGTAGWVQPPKYKKGLDPIGTQQPCIAVYSSLLPGITNVTDRVAYFGFGPWLTWAFAKRYPAAKAKEFKDTLRRGEVLLTLIGIRHGLKSGDQHIEEHGGTLVGVNTLQPIVEAMDNTFPIRLSQFATLDESPDRYFQNQWGGLGQYYLGALRDEYQLLAQNKDRGIDFTVERGEPLAEAVAAGVDGERFFRCLAADKVSVRDLDALSGCCPCQLRSPSRVTEREALLNIVLGRQPDVSQNASARRQSLALIVDFLRAASGSQSADLVDDFLAACYGGVLPNSRVWSPTPTLSAAIRGWAYYFRSELLSVAMQRLFREALIVIQTGTPTLPTIEDAGRWCAAHPSFAAARQQLRASSYDDLATATRRTLPKLSDIQNQHHELSFWPQVVAGSGSATDDITAAIRLIVTLLERATDSIDINVPTDHYPINPASIARRARERWPGMPLEAWLADTLTWIFTTHRKIAFRKLSQSGDDTRRLRMGDDGLYFDGDVIDVVRTQPRLRQAFRFLRDLGLVERADTGCFPVPTADATTFWQTATNAG